MEITFVCVLEFSEDYYNRSSKAASNRLQYRAARWMDSKMLKAQSAEKRWFAVN